ncbi:uncharacterized protein LOC129795690 [Lutzomyia longipalpis]|uniref:uncharacterized protein LOC129795690 n=1 Tax=Lutzomyia longipalpis TaxID=7200 RepID=UPI0024842F5A|nr:uncharacterized protein LOC129795690 [Lutzomyia longipalpis]
MSTLQQKRNMFKRIILEMEANPALWDTADTTSYQYGRYDKQIATQIAADKLNIPYSKCIYYVRYIKSQHAKEDARRKENNLVEDDGKGWPLYDLCSFLKSQNNAVIVRDFKKKEGNPENTEMSNCLSGSSSPAAPLIVDPDFDFICSSDDNLEPDGIQEHSKISLNESQDETCAIDPTRNLNENSQRRDKKFLIGNICSTLEYELSNVNYPEIDLVSFHGDVFKFMHSHFKREK